jgi:hypothetical protein
MDGEDWVIGIVIKNFFKGKARADAGNDENELPWCLDQSEVLICDLAEWHTFGQKRRYYVQSLEWTTTSEATIVRPVANWESSGRRSRRDQAPLSVRGKRVGTVIVPPVVMT